MSAARHRKLNAGRKGYDDVSAQSRFELFAGSNSSDEGVGSWFARFFSFAGMYETPSISALLYAFLLEFIGSFLLASAVSVAAYFVAGLNVMLAGLIVAAIYGGSYFAITRMPADHSLRRHLNSAITIGYVITSRIGIFGALFYMIAQYCGALMSGVLVGMALSPYATAIPIVQSTVPLPTVLTSSIHTVWCLELFGSAIIVMSLLVTEFAGTDETKAVENFHRGTGIAAMVTAIFVVIGYPFQVFTYNNVVYFGGLFANVFNTVAGRRIADLASLYDATNHPSSVFGAAGTDGGLAWMLYTGMPYVGGIIGSLLFLAVFMSRMEINTAKTIPDNKRRQTVSTDDVPNASLKAAVNQTPVAALVSPFLKTH